MKAILCLAIVICSVSIALAQPMVVEWEREIHFENDSLQGLLLGDIVESPFEQALYFVGEARGPEDGWLDSSDAFILKLSSTGDSLWTRLYDANFPDTPIEYFSDAGVLPSGRVVTGAYANALYFVENDDGNLTDTLTYECNRSIKTPVEYMTVGQDGRVFVGSRCVDFTPQLMEDAIVVCFAPDGEFLWSFTRSYGRFNWVRNIVPQPDGSIFVLISIESNPYGLRILHIDESGNDLGTFQPPTWLRDFVPLGDSTLLLATNIQGFNDFILSKVGLDGATITERRFSRPPSSNSESVSFTGGRIRVWKSGLEVMELNVNLDSLWSFQLDSSYTQGGGFVRLDGGRIRYDQVDPTTYRIKAIAPALFPIYSSDDMLNFGTVINGDSASRSTELANPSADSVQIVGISVHDGFAVTNQAPFWIHRDEVVTLEILFAPTEAIEYTDTVVITTDTVFDPIRIAVHGVALPSGADDVNPIGAKFLLSPAYPNPFNPSTTLAFSLAHNSEVRLNVFDIQGRLVSEVVRGDFAAGEHSVNWSCAECASGIYFATMKAGSFTASQKLLLLK